MRRPTFVILAMATMLAATLSLGEQARSQVTPAPEITEDSNREKILRGWDSLVEGLQDELTPGLEALRDWADMAGPALESFLEEMGPALTEVINNVRDWTQYETPEILDSGDIIIRRKQDAPPLELPSETEEDGPIDI